MFASALGGDGIAEAILHLRERLIGAVKFAEALLANPDSVEDPAADAVVEELGIGGCPLGQSGGVVVLEIGDVCEAGVNGGLEDGGRISGQRLDVGGAGGLEVGLGGGNVLRDAAFIASAFDVQRLGGAGAVGDLGEVNIGLGDGLIELLGFDGSGGSLEGGLFLRVRLRTTAAGWDNDE